MFPSQAGSRGDPLLWGHVTPPAPLRRALAALACALVLLPVLAVGPVAGAQERTQRPTTTLPQKGDRPTNYVGFGAIALGLTAWAVVFGVVLYRSPRRASMPRRPDPGVPT